MDKIIVLHRSRVYGASLLMSVFSLSLTSTSVNAAISSDCSGSSYCKDKTIDANTAGYVDKTPVYFMGKTDLTVSASQAFNNSKGTYEFRENTHVTVNAESGLNGGTYTLRGGSVPGKVEIDINASSGIHNAKLTALAGSNSVVNAGAEQAISGGSQIFNAGTTLNLNAADGVFNSTGLTLTDATLNLNASGAFSKNTMASGKVGSIKGGSSVNINAAGGMSGGQLNIQDTSVVNVTGNGSITGGTLLFTGKSVLNANSANAISGETNNTNKQIFQSGTIMNVNAAAALNGGNQTFNDATLNVNASQGISGGYQILAKNSVLNSEADRAVVAGQIKLQDSAVFNANGISTITGGTQNFNDNSILNANGEDTLSGGNQNFSGNSILNGNSKGTITGNSKQIFSNDSVFNANVSQAVTGGSSTTFKDNAVMNISAQHGVDGGNLLFDGKSTLNINTDDAIRGGEQRFKGDSLINLNHENSLYNTTLKLEGNSSINVNADNALNYTDHIVFSKTYDTTTGSALDVNGHSLTVGSISGNDTNAVIKNSSAQDAILTTGLYDYGVFAGQSYQYDSFLQRGAMRADAVVSSALGDITRQAGLALIPQFADRLVPEPSGMAQNGQGVWVRTLYGQQGNQGNGASKAVWQGHVKGIQIGTDLWPADEDSSHKLGLYVGYIDSNADVSGKTIYASDAQLGNYQFSTYGTGLYWRYTATQGWYTNTTFQLTRYSGQVESNNSSQKPDIHGRGQILAFEAGYPQVLNETLTLVPRISVSWQKVKLDDYRYDDLNVSNDLDNQLTASAGARLYWNTMTTSGIQWSPFLDAELNNQLTTRDRNKVTVGSTGYQDSLLTAWNGSAAKVSGGMTVKLNDYTNYYIKVDYQNGLSERSENTWQGTTGVSLYW
ncbi:autotransporter domain-containing protein [Salmonella enterica]|nr:autotransporter domain-containing protein [Salmonella enterica]EGF9691611.1 autotransporter domain-containing protein [Salmonella enterica]EJK8997404.1 autotransporter domain-containing protein [Salmonella enterica]